MQYGRFIFRGAEGVLLDVPYVPTEDHIVEEMFKLVELRDGDVLYDLGSGDGRIVIGAAKKANVRAVGIDIDPRRIAESKAKALAARLTGKAIFLQQDFFESDIKEAAVVTLFLLNEINLRLRPKLFRELRAGTRIVSHNFDMGDWKADKELSLGLWEDGFHNLYFWVLPANVSGRWTGRHKGESWTLLINQRFQRIEGSLLINGKFVLPFSEAAISGDVIRFIAKSEGQGKSITFEGKARGNLIEGMSRENGAKGALWKAIRDPATISWIE